VQRPRLRNYVVLVDTEAPKAMQVYESEVETDKNIRDMATKLSARFRSLVTQYVHASGSRKYDVLLARDTDFEAMKLQLPHLAGWNTLQPQKL